MEESDSFFYKKYCYVIETLEHVFSVDERFRICKLIKKNKCEVVVIFYNPEDYTKIIPHLEFIIYISSVGNLLSTSQIINYNNENYFGREINHYNIDSLLAELNKIIYEYILKNQEELDLCNELNNILV